MWKLFKITNLLYFFASSYAWWSFSFPANIMLVIFNIIMMACLMTCPFRMVFTKRAVYITVTIFAIAAISTYLINISLGLVSFFNYIPALFLFILPLRYKQDLLVFITKWYSVILVLSLVTYALTYIVSIPTIGSFHPENLNYPPYENYVFFIKTTMYDNFIYRFNGPFLEPGHQAMISGILLFANKYNFKGNKLLWIPLISIFLSFSLAGYIILAVGMILIFVRSVIKLLGFGIIFLIIHFIVSDLWNDGINPVNILIFDRMQYDEEKGITGNNRTLEQTDFYFEKCVENGTIITGVRSMKEENLKIRGAGYKIFLLRYGLILLLATFILYFLLISPKSLGRYSISFLILLSIVFLQRAYPTWYSWLLPYVLAVNTLSKDRFSKLKSNITV